MLQCIMFETTPFISCVYMKNRPIVKSSRSTHKISIKVFKSKYVHKHFKHFVISRPIYFNHFEVIRYVVLNPRDQTIEVNPGLSLR